MARQRGTEAEINSRRLRLRQALGRGVGFIILAGLGMAIIAALVLMPAWAGVVDVRHARDMRKASDQHVEKYTQTEARLINATPHDPILTERLARGTSVQDLIHAPKFTPPPTPSGWELELADKLAQTKTRRGLFCVAIVSLGGAMFLFGPPPIKRPSQSRRKT